MTAYGMVDIDIHAQALYDEYKEQAPATVAAYGGKYLARGGRTGKFEGEWLPKRLVILQFDSIEQARKWLDSPEYGRIMHQRHGAAHSNMVAIEGV